MGPLISGITKIFTSIGTGVATLGSAVRAVGASLFTASAASGAGLASATTGGGLGGLLSGLTGGGGVLGNMLSGAIKQGISGGLIGGLMGSISGQGFMSGMKGGAVSGAVGGGVGAGVESLFSPTGIDTISTGSTSPVVAADTPTGAAPKFDTSATAGTDAWSRAMTGGPTSATTPPTTEPQTGGLFNKLGFKGFGDFIANPGVVAAIGGIGESIAAQNQIDALERQQEANRDFLRESEERVTASYDVPASALAGGEGTYQDKTKRPTPAQMWSYNPGSGMIEYV